MSLQRLTRIFKKGPTRLLDPDPAMTPDQVLEHYTDLYPELANATVSEPETAGAELVYTFEKPIVKTKGGMVVGPATVTVVKAQRGGMECNAYKHELDAVLQMIGNGSLGSMHAKGGITSWGDENHRGAIDAVGAGIEILREKFARMDAIDAARKQPCPHCGGEIAEGFESDHHCGD